MKEKERHLEFAEIAFKNIYKPRIYDFLGVRMIMQSAIMDTIPDVSIDEANEVIEKVLKQIANDWETSKEKKDLELDIKKKSDIVDAIFGKERT